MKLDFSRFQPLAGRQPALFVARHPSGSLLALQTLDETGAAPELGIWDEETGALIWTDKGVAALAWTANGTQLLLWALALPTVQAAKPGRFERRTWPADELLSACSFELPFTPWPHDLWVAPGGQLAAVRWVDEGLSGWEPVVLSTSCDVHLAGAGFMLDSGVAADTQPVVSPGGRYAVSGYQTLHVTSPDGLLVPRQHGRFEVGQVIVMDLRACTFHDIFLDDAVPAKLHGTAARWRELPMFLDDTHFRLTLPTGGTRVFAIPE